MAAPTAPTDDRKRDRARRRLRYRMILASGMAAAAAVLSTVTVTGINQPAAFANTCPDGAVDDGFGGCVYLGGDVGGGTITAGPDPLPPNPTIPDPGGDTTGGDQGGGGGPAPNPNPTSSPSPSPTPTPCPSGLPGGEQHAPPPFPPNCFITVSPSPSHLVSPLPNPPKPVDHSTPGPNLQAPCVTWTAGKIFHANESFTCSRPDGFIATLIMQGDGNLVIYGPTGAIWNTHTAGHPGAYAILQGNGRLNVFQGDGSPALWISNTNAPGGNIETLSFWDGYLTINTEPQWYSFQQP